MINIIALLHQNFNLTSDIEDLYQRVSPHHREYQWTQDFYRYMEKNHLLSDEIKELVKNQTAAYCTMKDFYESYPYLKSKYTNNDFSLQDGMVSYRFDFKVLKRQYHISFRVPDEVEQIEGNNEGNLREKILLIEECGYIFELFSGKKHLPLTRKDEFLETMEFLIETDNMLLANIHENNPALSSYRVQRNLIPRILGSCTKDTLLKPVSNESAQVYQNLLSQSGNNKEY